MMKFELGQMVATPGVLAAMQDASQTPLEFIRRHLKLDAGELSSGDQKANLDAVRDGGRVFSSFLLNDGTKIWVITEAVGDDGRRASTCIMLPDEY